MAAPSEPRTDDAARDPEGRSRSRSRRKRRSWAKRRHLGLITTLLALLVLVAGVLIVLATWDSGRVPLSQQGAALDPGTAAASTAPATTSAAPSSASAPVSVSVRATITAIIGDNQWTAKTEQGLTPTVVVTPATTFIKQRTFASYAVGDIISVDGTLSAGVITATAITGKPASG